MLCGFFIIVCHSSIIIISLQRISCLRGGGERRRLLSTIPPNPEHEYGEGKSTPHNSSSFLLLSHSSVLRSQARPQCRSTANEREFVWRSSWLCCRSHRRVVVIVIIVFAFGVTTFIFLLLLLWLLLVGMNVAAIVV